jgi:hypothetical protein
MLELWLFPSIFLVSSVNPIISFIKKGNCQESAIRQKQVELLNFASNTMSGLILLKIFSWAMSHICANGATNQSENVGNCSL